jgi:hypothetical protein
VPHAADLEILESKGILDLELFGVGYVEKVKLEHLAPFEALHRVCPLRDALPVALIEQICAQHQTSTPPTDAATAPCSSTPA